MPEEPTNRKPPEHTDTTINQILGNHGNAAQLRDVHGDVHIGAHADSDVEVVLQPERPEVVADVGDKCTVIPVTVNSHLPRPLTVKLSLRNAPTKQWTVEPSEVTVGPGVPAHATVRLPCTATEPQAGPKYLRVVARHRHGKREWQSEPPITVTVQARPDLVVDPEVTPNVIKGRQQTVTVTVRNNGNTRLTGSLRRWVSPESEAGYLPLEAIGPPATGGTPPFQLAPGETEERLVVVTLPPPEVKAKKWHLPIAVWLDGDTHPCTVPELTVTQLGWSAEIPDYVKRLTEWARVEHGPYRRVTLAIAGVAVFIAGLLFGANVFSSQPTNEGAAVATSPSDQIATSSVPPLFAPVHYEPMACTAGTSVLYLASMTKREADEYAAYFVQREYSRMNTLKPRLNQPYTIHVTDRADLCPALRRLLDQSPSMTEYSTFIWIGVPTSEAADTCKKLGRQQTFDCYGVPVT